MKHLSGCLSIVVVAFLVWGSLHLKSLGPELPQLQTAPKVVETKPVPHHKTRRAPRILAGAGLPMPALTPQPAAEDVLVTPRLPTPEVGAEPAPLGPLPDLKE